VFKALGSAKGFPRWNFNKYLVLHDGSIAERFKANISPSHPRLKVPVKTALGI
jgi:glutathione peroxidase